MLHVAETGSTNTDLLAMAAPGGTAADADRVVLMADHQTAGRGRLDRRWDAPPGANLLVSILLREVPDHVHEVTQRVALAAREACRGVAGAHVDLKWPNDLLLDGRKVAGILAQAGSVGAGAASRVDHVVVGIGLNVAWAPEAAARLDDVAAVPVDRFDLLRALLVAIDGLAPGEVAATYRERLGTIGQRVRVHLPGDLQVEGTAVDVEPDGRLVVIDTCAVTHRIDTGDVVHLRPA